MHRIEGMWARFAAGCFMLTAVLGLAGCSSNRSGGGGGTPPSVIQVAFQTSPPASLNTGSAPVPLSAVVTNDAASRGVDWVLSCATTPPNCGTLSPLHSDSGASVTYTPPNSIAAKSEMVNVVAFAATDHSSNAPSSFTVVGVEAGVGGTYVFEALGNFFGSPSAVSGVLVLDGAGGITGGELSCVACTTPGSPPPATPVAVSGGSYSLDAGGNGTLTVTASVPGGSDLTLGFGLAVLSGAKLLLTESDSSGLVSGTGTMDRQTSTAIPSGSFAFVMSGQVTNDPSGAAAYPQPVGFGGVFAIDSTNAITGVGDENLDGMVTTNVALTGSIVPLDTKGAVVINLNGAFPPPASPAGLISPPIQLSGYIVDEQHIKLIGTPDVNTSLGFSVGGMAVGQGVNAGTFTANSALSGPFVYGILGQGQTIADVNQPTATPEAWASAAWAGVFTADGAGNLTNGNADQEVGFGIPPVTDTLSGTYIVDPSGIGRVLATTSFGSAGVGPSFVFYLTGAGNPALALETDQAPGGGVPGGGVGAGIAYPQATGTISYNGMYGLNLTANNFGTEADASAVINVDGAGGTLAGNGNIGSTATGTVAPGVVNGTFMSGANGRFPGSLNLLDAGNNPISMGQGAFYLADPTQGFFIENDGVQVSLGYFVTATPSP